MRNGSYLECLVVVHACFLGSFPSSVRLAYCYVIYSSCALFAVEGRDADCHFVTLLEAMEIVLTYVECEPHVVEVGHCHDRRALSYEFAYFREGS